MFMIYLTAILTAPFFIHILHFAMQKGQIFGIWQKVLDYFYGSEKLQWLEKPLGGCYLCFSNLIAAIVVISLWVFHERPFNSIVISLILSSFMITTITTISVLLHNFIESKNKKENGL